MATKKYESLRIMSLEGSAVFKNEGFTATKDGKPDPKAFRGVLDDSLDTLKLAEVYDRHKSELAYPYLDGKKRFCRAVVSLSFNRAIKLYESYGNRYVLNGYSVTDADMRDHVCVSTVGGKPTMIAIDVSFRENSGYAPVEEPIAEGILGKYFKYDADTRSYKRSDKTIPTDISCLEIREHLYTHGFDIDGIHYVRYKRNAGAIRDGRCLFIAEPLYADMMAWSACDLSANTASDQASWQAYIALTLSSIERTIRLPKKSILIIRDRVSRFTENVICVKETDTHDLRAEEEETEIENVIWDGEALLDTEIFNVNGYGTRGMMLLRNRFFKTCAFNTNLQDWFFDNDITQVSRLAGYTTASIIRWIFITTSAFSRYCREWRSTRRSVCTPSIRARCSPACAITARITRKITAAICPPSTNISWATKAPMRVRTTLTLKRLWLSFMMRRMPLPAEQPTQGHFPCPSCSILIPRTQVRTIRTKSRIS